MIDYIIKFAKAFAKHAKEIADKFVSSLDDTLTSEDETEEGEKTRSHTEIINRILVEVIVPTLLLAGFKAILSSTGLGAAFPAVYQGLR